MNTYDVPPIGFRCFADWGAIEFGNSLNIRIGGMYECTRTSLEVARRMNTKNARPTGRAEWYFEYVSYVQCTSHIHTRFVIGLLDSSGF